MQGWSSVGRGGAFVGVFVLGALSALGAAVLATPSAGQKEPGDDPALLRELAERLLLPNPEARDARFRLLPDTLPAELPFSLPLPPDSLLVGSAVRSIRRGDTEGGRAVAFTEVNVVLDAATSPAEVIAFYDGAFGDEGWFLPGGGRPPGALPPATAPRAGRVFCGSQEGPSVTISAFADGTGPSDVRMQIVIGTPLPVPCGDPPRPPAP